MMKRILIVTFSIFLLIILMCIISLFSNKTFFKTTYIGVNNQEIFIPKYSFFKRESGMTCASFNSLKSEKVLKEEIQDYMKDFEYFEDETPYGYRKGDLYIQSYKVVNEGLYRIIYITY